MLLHFFHNFDNKLISIFEDNLLTKKAPAALYWMKTRPYGMETSAYRMKDRTYGMARERTE